MRRAVVVTALIATALPAAAAEAPYVGKWKINQAKSVLTGDTVSIESAADGMMQFSSQGFVYRFKTDGKEYPMPNGGTTAWTATSPTVWDVSNRMNGKVVNTYHLVVNGATLSVSGKAIKPDGSSADFSSSYKRVSGGSGFAGKWMSTDVKMPVMTIEIASSGANGVSIKDDTGSESTGQFDGKDNATRGQMAGSKSTIAFKELSGSSFEVTNKLDGKPMYTEVYSVSADGRTLTIDGTPVNAQGEKYKIVFDRQ